ncbi:MAG: response regulator, partial [Gemmatimonadaceae bacterium]
MLRNPTRTVLIVEPDDDSRSALRDTLEREGYTVVSTASAADALSVVESPEISLVITELYLSDGGKDRCLVHAIRQSAARKRTKVLAYTRHGLGVDRTWAIEQDANGYV